MNNTNLAFSVYDDHAVVSKYIGTSKEVVIPEEYNGFPVTSISGYCFYRSNIKSIVGKSITSIGEYAFQECTSLTMVDFPVCANVYDFAFTNCTSLTSINLPACESVGDTVFYGCKNLAKINLPVCKFIGSSAFQNCYSLTKINLPACTSIGYDAFRYCTKLIKKGKYKATNIDLTCLDFQYETGKWFKEEEAILCKRGFHYVENVYDLFNYYWGEIGKDLRIFEIKSKEISDERMEDSKRVCRKIKLVKEIKSYQDFF